MPLLFVPVTTPVLFNVDTSRIESRFLAFRDLDGNYPFEWGDNDFLFGPDAEGLDLPPREIITRQIPGMAGERISEIRVGRREVFLPFAIRGVDGLHLDLLDKRDQLARLFDEDAVDYQTQDGTLDLVARSLRGERALRCVYVDGMTSGGRAPSGGVFYQKLGVTLWAVQPYWVGAPWAMQSLRVPDAPDWFDTFPGELTASRTLGQPVTATIEGDVPSWAVVDLVGPADSVYITGPSLSVSIPDGLADGEPCQIVTNPRGRTALFSGVKDPTRVGPSDTYRPLGPGDVSLTIAMAGATAASSAIVSGPTLWKRPW